MLFVVLLKGRFVLLNLFHQPFVYIHMNSCIFTLHFGHNPILCSFIVQTVPALDLGSSFMLAPVSVWHTPSLFPSFSGTSLLSGIRKCSDSTCIWPAPVLESAVSLRSSGSFYWQMAFRSQDLGVGVLIAAGASLLPGPLRGQSEETHVKCNPYMQTHLYLFCISL